MVCQRYASRGRPLKPRRPFVIERRPIAPRVAGRTFMQYAAEPDALTELRATADQLQNVPREWLENRQDMCHGLRRVAGRLRKIAERIEPIDPAATKAASLKPVNAPTRRACRMKLAGQLEMALG